MDLDDWEKEWVYSEHPGKEFGKFKRTAGKFYNDEVADKGMRFESKCFRTNSIGDQASSLDTFANFMRMAPDTWYSTKNTIK